MCWIRLSLQLIKDRHSCRVPANDDCIKGSGSNHPPFSLPAGLAERGCRAPEQKQPSLNRCNQSKSFSIFHFLQDHLPSVAWLCPSLLPLISSLSAYSPLPTLSLCFPNFLLFFFSPTPNDLFSSLFCSSSKHTLHVQQQDKG